MRSYIYAKKTGQAAKAARERARELEKQGYKTKIWTDGTLFIIEYERSRVGDFKDTTAQSVGIKRAGDEKDGTQEKL